MLRQHGNRTKREHKGVDEARFGVTLNGAHNGEVWTKLLGNLGGLGHLVHLYSTRLLSFRNFTNLEGQSWA
jgi:hypothetical protein